MTNKIIGSGGGGGKSKSGGGSVRQAQEAADSLSSAAFARIIDLVSEGEIEGLVNGLKSIYLDDTPIQNSDNTFNFTGVSAAWRNGTQDQAYIQGFPAVEQYTDVSTEVKHSLGSVTRTVTDTDCNAVVVTVSTGPLYVQNTSNGDINGTSVSYKINVTPYSGTPSEFSGSISGKTRATYQRSHRLPLNGTGPWLITVTKLTADSTSAYIQTPLVWAGFTSVIDRKLRYPNSAIVGLSVDSRQFNSIPKRSYHIKGLRVKVPSNYDPVARTYLGNWDGTFKVAWTNNPAWCVYDILLNKRYGLGKYIEPWMVNKWSLYTIAQYCDEMVPSGFAAGAPTQFVKGLDGSLYDSFGTKVATEPRFTLNCVLSSRFDAYRVLNNFATTFRGMLYPDGASIAAYQDAPEDSSFLFNASNVIGGVFKYAGSARSDRHTVALVTFNDPTNQFKQEVEYVDDPEGIKRYGVREIEVMAFGCTSRGQAHRYGKWLLLTERLESDFITFTSFVNAGFLRPGRVVDIADSHRSGKRMGGRVMAATANTITVDAPVTLEQGIAYSLEVMLPSGSVERRAVLSADADGTTLSVTADFSGLPVNGAVWVLVAENLAPIQARIIKVADVDGQHIEFTAVEHVASKYTAVEQNLVLEERPTAVPAAVKLGAVTNPAASVVQYIDPTGAYKPKILVSWDSMDSPSLRCYTVSYRYNGDNWIYLPDTYAPGCEITGAYPGSYVLHITPIGIDGRFGSAVNLNVDVPEYDPSAVNGTPVVSVASPWVGTTLELQWSALSRVRGYRVRISHDTTMLRSFETPDTALSYTLDMLIADTAGHPVRSLKIEVAGVDYSGNYGAYGSLDVSNPQVAAPSGVAIKPLLEGLYVSCNTVADTDYAGCRVWVSEVPGFDPGVTAPVYDGVSTHYSCYGLSATTAYYVRIGLYDQFGTDAMNLSSELTVTSRGITADPQDTLNEINNLLTADGADTKLELTADRFRIKSSDGDKTPFAIVDVGGGVYKTLLNSDVLVGGSVDIANLRSGSLPTDVIMRLGGGTIELDGEGEIRVYKALGTNQDFVRLTSAQIEFIRYITGVGYVTYNYLSRVESGQAASGTTVTIPGYWKAQPRVMVSPASLGLYKAAYASQDQSVMCQATNLVETAAGSGQWKFDATATLVLSAATGNNTVNVSSGDISTNTWTSTAYTTVANCASITPSVSLKSYRGNGNSQYYSRSIRWRVEYYSGGTWVAGSWRIVSMGAQISAAVSDSFVFNFPSSGVWQWRIYTEAYDTDGSVFGSVTYTYSSETVYASDETNPVNFPTKGVPYYVVSDYDPPALTGEIYQIDYVCTANISITGNSSATRTASTRSGLSAGYTGATPTSFSSYLRSGASAVGVDSGTSWDQNIVKTTVINKNVVVNKLSTVSGSNLTFNPRYWIFGGGVETNSQETVYEYDPALVNMSAKIYRRKVAVNSTTPVNNFALVSWGYSLTAAQVLATGSLNWQATGE